MFTLNDPVRRLQEQSQSLVAGLRDFAVPAFISTVLANGRVASALCMAVPEFSSGDLLLQQCEMKGLRLGDDSNCWTGFWEVLAVHRTTGEQQRVKLDATLIPPGLPEPESRPEAAWGSPAWHCYLPDLRLELRWPEPDPGLPALAQLTDPVAARAILEASLRAAAPKYRDLALQACVPDVRRYNPGSRCTIVYKLEYSPLVHAAREWPQAVVAKVYHGDKGRNAYYSMAALCDSPLASSAAVSIAEPIAWLGDLRVLIQGTLPEEQTLKELARDALNTRTPEIRASLRGYLEKTGAGLFDLHRSGVRYGETATWEMHIDDLRRRCEHMDESLPGLLDVVEPVVAALAGAAESVPADAFGPAHSSFRPSQVLLHQGRVGFIDFDGFCQAEPAMDLALFSTTLESLALDNFNGRENGTERLRFESRLAETRGYYRDFLAGYGAARPVSELRVALWSVLYLLDLVMSSWAKLKLQRKDAVMALLDDYFQSGVLAAA